MISDVYVSVRMWKICSSEDGYGDVLYVRDVMEKNCGWTHEKESVRTRHHGALVPTRRRLVNIVVLWPFVRSECQRSEARD